MFWNKKETTTQLQENIEAKLADKELYDAFILWSNSREDGPHFAREFIAGARYQAEKIQAAPGEFDKNEHF